MTMTSLPRSRTASFASPRKLGAHDRGARARRPRRTLRLERGATVHARSGLRARGSQRGHGRSERRLDPDPQGGVEDGRKLRQVIGWKLVPNDQPARPLHLSGDQCRWRTRDGRRVPGAGKDAEILALIRGTSLLHVAAEAALRASVTLPVAASSLLVSGNSPTTVNAGGFGACDAVASALMMRLIADSTR